MNKFISLKNIIDVKDFQKIQEDISKATGVAILTTDYKGKPFTKHSCCTEFCKIIRSDKNFTHLCEKCDSMGGLEAARCGKPYIYKCHMGLVDFAIPIIVEDQYLGLLMGGQILVEEENSNLENIVPIHHSIEEHKLKSAYKNLTVMSLNKIQSIAEMLFHISNYIIGEALFKMSQEEIDEKDKDVKRSKFKQIELERELEKSTLKSLECITSQRFIFNILNSACSLAIIEDAPNTREVLFKLSNMIRFSYEKSNKVVTIEEELKYILDYLSLQKIRFSKRLDFSINMDDRYKSIKIPFMMIYPFVENAITHGLKSKDKGAFINISLLENDEFIVVSIKDNGIGIEEDLLENINMNKKINGNGISNVKERMNKFYRYNYKIDIKSEINKGTEVIIKFLKE